MTSLLSPPTRRSETEMSLMQAREDLDVAALAR